MIFMKHILFQVGSNYSKTTAGIYHQTCKEECPSQCTNQWKYSNNGWHVDFPINISCGKMLRCYMIRFLISN